MLGGPGASHLGTWESTDLDRPVLFFLDICSDFVVSFPSMPGAPSLNRSLIQGWETTNPVARKR